MNNINKKNKIFSLSVSSEVPNKNTSEVTVKNNQIIYTSINNNLQKLVDNDIFIEKELNKERFYQIGPKTYLENELSSQVNGYKMWNKNIKSPEPLSILHKINYELDDTIIDTEIKSNVNFIVDIGNERLIGTNSGLYTLDNDNNITDTIISGKKIISYATKLNDEYIVVTTDDGIYQLSNNLATDQWVSYLKNDVKNIEKIFVDDDYIYIGDENGLSFCNYQKNTTTNYDFIPYKLNTTTNFTEKPISLNQINNKKIVVSNNGIFSNSKYNSFDEIVEISIPNNSEVKTFVKFKNNLYITTTHGLYEIRDNELKLIGDVIGNVISHSIFKGVLYVIIDSCLYKYKTTLEKICDLKTTINKNTTLGVYNDIVVISTNNKIYYININNINIDNISSWNVLENTTIDKNLSQIYDKCLLVTGKDTNEKNILLEIEFNGVITRQLVEENDIVINKIIKHESGNFILTNKGLYKNINEKIKFNDDIIDNNNLIDMYINGLNWIIISQSSDGNNIIYGNDISNLSVYKKIIKIEYQKICFTNGILLLIDKENHLYYTNDFNFDTEVTVLNPKLITNTIDITQIYTLENNFYILDNSGNLYNLLLKYNYSLETYNGFSSEFPTNYQDKIRGFNESYTTSGKTNKVFYGEDNNYLYTNLSAHGKTNNINYITTLGNIEYACGYSYYYDTSLSNGTKCDWQLKEIKETGKPTQYLSTFTSFTKDLFMIYGDGKFQVYEWKEDSEDIDNDGIDNERIFRQLSVNIESPTNIGIDLPPIKGMYHFYDKYKSKIYDSHGEKPEISYTFLFGENSISIFNLFIDTEHYETYKIYSKFTNTELGLSNVPLIEGEYCHCKYSLSKKTLNKLSNLKCVTNTNSLDKENLLFFATKDNQLKYYLQNKNKDLIEDFENDNIKSISTPLNNEEIISIAAASITDDGNKIKIAIQTNINLYTNEIEIVSNQLQVDEKAWHIGAYENNDSKILGYNKEIITLSNEKLAYNNIVEVDNYELTKSQKGSINNLKIINNKLYEIYDDKIVVDDKIIKIPNIKNITYENNKFYLMGETGLSSINELSNISLLEKNDFLETKEIIDVWKDFYIGISVYFSINLIDELRLNIKQEKKDLIDEINNLKIIDNKLTFINQDQELRILNADYSTKPFEIENKKKDTIPLYRNTENLYVGINGEMYQKGNNEQVITDLSKTINDDMPILQDEINHYFIRNDNKHTLYKYNEIKLGDYSNLISDITGIEKVYQFNDEYLLLLEENKIYYYYPEFNMYFLKYQDNDIIKNLQKENEKYIINVGNKLYDIDNNFRQKNKKYILTDSQINSFYKLDEFNYLLGSERGLRKTQYKYRIENDIPLCSLTNIKDTIWTEYEIDIKQHLSSEHNLSSTISKINDNIMPVDCSNLKGIENNLEISNYIKTIEFGDGVQHISATVSFENELKTNDTSLSNISYIYKNYGRNDESELLIYIPSTNTNYINHISEIKNDKNKTEKIYRKNVENTTSRNINDNKTILTIQIDKEHFDINRITSFEINGNSLPLKIYIDEDNKHLFKNKYFSSIIKKSVLKQLQYKEDRGILEFQFLIFGTDAQAIRLYLN